MSKEAKGLNKTALTVLIIANISIVVVTITIWILLNELLKFSPFNTLIATLAFSTGVSLILATAVERAINQPFKLLSDAVHFLHQDSTATPAPSVSPQVIGSSVVRETITKMYELATNIRDVTTDLHTENDHITHILNQIPSAVIVLDASQKVIYTNTQGEATLDVRDPEELDTLNIHTLLDLRFEDEYSLKRWINDCTANKIQETKFWSRVRLTKKDKKEQHFDLSAHYSKNDPANAVITLVLTDRTEEYSHDESQMDFVALAAHELRSPITVIRGYLDVFKNEFGDNLTPEKQRLINRMSVAASQLSSYINNILNVAKYEQGTMKIHQVNADWPAVIEIALRPLRMRAKAHGRTIELKVHETIPSVAVDRSAITQVITNLVDNAIKYSDEKGVITIKVHTDGDDMVETQVIDNGIGIPESVLGNIFKKFYRSHRSKTQISGTGLGLFLSKVIVESHGGTIWVRSKENHGTTVGFSIPTYASKEDNLRRGTQSIEHRSEGWIKNHAMIRK